MREQLRRELHDYVLTVSQNCRALMDETARLSCFAKDLLLGWSDGKLILGGS